MSPKSLKRMNLFLIFLVINIIIISRTWAANKKKCWDKKITFMNLKCKIVPSSLETTTDKKCFQECKKNKNCKRAIFLRQLNKEQIVLKDYYFNYDGKDMWRDNFLHLNETAFPTIDTNVSNDSNIKPGLIRINSKKNSRIRVISLIELQLENQRLQRELKSSLPRKVSSEAIMPLSKNPVNNIIYGKIEELVKNLHILYLNAKKALKENIHFRPNRHRSLATQFEKQKNKSENEELISNLENHRKESDRSAVLENIAKNRNSNSYVHKKNDKILKRRKRDFQHRFSNRKNRNKIDASSDQNLENLIENLPNTVETRSFHGSKNGNNYKGEIKLIYKMLQNQYSGNLNDPINNRNNFRPKKKYKKPIRYENEHELDNRKRLRRGANYEKESLNGYEAEHGYLPNKNYDYREIHMGQLQPNLYSPQEEQIEHRRNHFHPQPVIEDFHLFRGRAFPHYHIRYPENYFSNYYPRIMQHPNSFDKYYENFVVEPSNSQNFEKSVPSSELPENKQIKEPVIKESRQSDSEDSTEYEKNFMNTNTYGEDYTIINDKAGNQFIRFKKPALLKKEIIELNYKLKFNNKRDKTESDLRKNIQNEKYSKKRLHDNEIGETDRKKYHKNQELLEPVENDLEINPAKLLGKSKIKEEVDTEIENDSGNMSEDLKENLSNEEPKNSLKQNENSIEDNEMKKVKGARSMNTSILKKSIKKELSEDEEKNDHNNESGLENEYFETDQETAEDAVENHNDEMENSGQDNLEDDNKTEIHSNQSSESNLKDADSTTEESLKNSSVINKSNDMDFDANSDSFDKSNPKVAQNKQKFFKIVQRLKNFLIQGEKPEGSIEKNKHHDRKRKKDEHLDLIEFNRDSGSVKDNIIKNKENIDKKEIPSSKRMWKRSVYTGRISDFVNDKIESNSEYKRGKIELEENGLCAMINTDLDSKPTLECVKGDSKLNVEAFYNCFELF